MTEAEARTKWCPISMVLTIGQDASGNRYTTGQPVGYCIASACMMWRWYQGPATITEIRGERQPESGHCGLAGNP